MEYHTINSTRIDDKVNDNNDPNNNTDVNGDNVNKNDLDTDDIVSILLQATIYNDWKNYMNLIKIERILNQKNIRRCGQRILFNGKDWDVIYAYYTPLATISNTEVKNNFLNYWDVPINDFNPITSSFHVKQLLSIASGQPDITL
ncbi:hypothetical protein G6F37_004116 [Rhizopus arrhizus]|nr:hypothetical protein G6F38_003549 [Rhizopus arrhizus]KAG1160308.1 hypothetical protein G6F37_004116 [Rhizopus arrhizus]